MDKKSKLWLGSGAFTAIGSAICGALDVIGRFYTANSLVAVMPSMEINWLPIYIFLFSGGLVMMGFGLSDAFTMWKEKKKNKWKEGLIPLEDVAGFALNFSPEYTMTPETTLELLKEAAKRQLITVYGVDTLFPSTLHKIDADFWDRGGVFFVEHWGDKLNISIYRSSAGKEVYAGGKIHKSHYDDFRKFVETYRDKL